MASEKSSPASKEEPLERQLWKAADKLRKNIDAAEYKHVVLGLICKAVKEHGSLARKDNYVDIYDIAQAVEDGATVRIYYESRLAKVSLSEEGRQMVTELDEELEQDELTETVLKQAEMMAAELAPWVTRTDA